MLAKSSRSRAPPICCGRYARRGFRVVLASSGKKEHVEHYLDLIDGRDLADAWTTSDDVEDDQARARSGAGGAGEGGRLAPG